MGRGREKKSDKVEVRLKGSKGDQGKKYAVLARTRNDWARERESGDGGTVELLVELLWVFRG